MLGKALIKELENDSKYRNLKVLSPTRLELDLESKESCEDFFERNRPSIVFHLAAKVMGLQGNLKYQTASLVENSCINLNILSAAIKFPPQEFFFAGTAASYAYPYKSMPLRESDFLEGDVHESEFGYAWAKRASYPWLQILRNEFGVKVIYGILTNLFGPNDRFVGENTHVIPALINRASKTKESKEKNFDIWGFPSVTRDFLFAPDAASIIVNLMKTKSPTSLFINIGSGIETSMEVLAETIRNNYGFSKINWLHDKPIGVQRRFLDIENIRSLGISTNSIFEDRLSETISWHTKNMHTVR